MQYGLLLDLRCVCTSKKLDRRLERPLYSSCPTWFASAANFRFPPISVIVGLSKTFNNHLGFERGFWQRQLGCFGVVPKTAVFGTMLQPI